MNLLLSSSMVQETLRPAASFAMCPWWCFDPLLACRRPVLHQSERDKRRGGGVYKN